MLNFFAGKRVLITGGTGTIGRALVHCLLQHNVEVIRVFSRDEAKQWEMQQDYNDHPRLRFLLGDVRDKERLHRAMEGVDLVFHTAAFKHVPACEYNPFEAVKTNVLGTQNVIEAAIETGVQRVVATGSDKAIGPTNAMGATKLLAERLITAADYSKGPRPLKLSSVRFGNVMGSRGSVIPLFRRQTLTQRRVTVTDPYMSRYMMSVDEAVRLTMDAMRLSQGGEVFVLKMPVVRIGDLAAAVVAEICARHDLDPEAVEIELVGLRPGEKRYEELLSVEEAQTAVELDDMYVIRPVFGDPREPYPGERPLAVRTYSSRDELPLSPAEVRHLVRSAMASPELGGIELAHAGDGRGGLYRAVVGQPADW